VPGQPGLSRTRAGGTTRCPAKIERASPESNERHLANDSASGAAIYLRHLGTAASPPADVADLCRQVGDIPGSDILLTDTRRK
jgi:hypothetical protein